jgi:hypothetical protein
MSNETPSKTPKIKVDIFPPEGTVVVPKDGPKTIPVKSLTFFDPHPNFTAKTSISAETALNKGRITIEFVPSMRHHRVEIHTPDHAPRIVFVQEGHVAGWEPLV